MQPKPLYRLFNLMYTKEEIDEVIKSLSEEEIELLKIKYNNGFDNNASGDLSEEQKQDFQRIYIKMAYRLKRNRKKEDLILKKQKLEEVQKEVIEKEQESIFNEDAASTGKYNLHEMRAINTVLSVQRNDNLQELIPSILLNYTAHEIFILIAAFGHTNKKISPRMLAEILDITERDILDVVAKYDKDYSEWILTGKDLGLRFNSKDYSLFDKDNEKIAPILKKLKNMQQNLIPEVLIRYNPREMVIIMSVYECIGKNITFETATELLGISESKVLDVFARYVNDCCNYKINMHKQQNFDFENYYKLALGADIDSYTVNERRIISDVSSVEEYNLVTKSLVPEILINYTLNEIFIFIAIFGYTSKIVTAKKIASLLDISESEILDMAARYDKDYLDYLERNKVVTEDGYYYEEETLRTEKDGFGSV